MSASAPSHQPAVSGQDPFTTPEHPYLLFFDSDCSFCARWVERVMKADTSRRTRFATLQGPTCRRLARIYPDAQKASSVVLVKRRPDGTEEFFRHSTAIRKLIDGLPGFGLFAFILHIVPTPICDLGYIIFSHLRGVLFAKWAHERPPVERSGELFVD